MIIFNRSLKDLKNELKDICSVVCKIPMIKSY